MKNRPHADKLAVIANQETAEREYWLGQLADQTEKTNFPFDFTKENETAAPKKTVTAQLQGELFSKLLKISKNSDVKLNMILTAGLVILLKKYACTNNITMGTPIYKQEIDTDFINTVLVLRHRLSDGMTFKQLLLLVRDTINNATKHQNFPIDFLTGHLNIPVRENESPFFDIALLLRNIHYKKYITDVPYFMLFDFNKADNCVEAEIEYLSLLYRRSTIEQIFRHYTRVLEVVLADVEIPLSGVDILSAEEKKQLLEDFNDTGVDFPTEITFHQLFERQAAETPGNIAVIGTSYGEKKGDVFISYEELKKKSSQMALFLREKGVKPDTIVAVMAGRSVEMIFAVMAVMKAGGAYLPIDPGYPEERMNYMLTDSGTEILITDLPEGHRFNRFNCQLSIVNCQLLMSAAAASPTHLTHLTHLTHPTHLGYVIYTSGSTGRPKAVMVQHNHFVNAALAWRKEYRLQEMEVHLLQMASFSFDVFAGDLARVLLNSGKMVIHSAPVLDPQSIYELINRCRITLFESTPSYIIPFMRYVYDNRLEVGIDSLQLLILGSDTCLSRDFKELAARSGKRMRIINSYGITEATIDSSYYEPLPGEELPSVGSVPIGKPLPNVTFYILDPAGSLLPVGVPGELYIGGSGIARGYLNNPEMTSEKFCLRRPGALFKKTAPGPRKNFLLNKSFSGVQGAVFQKSPLVAEGRIYKTGDRARWLSDGNMEFLGRMDYQVKVRGYRIELGEIENRLLEHQEIRQAVVVEKIEQSGDRYLCAYIISDKVPGREELRDYLGKKLPDYMIPWFFVAMERFPLTPNGKIDRNALPEPETIKEAVYVAPGDETEAELVKMWAEVLAVDKENIGIDHRFFDLGGNSLKAIVLISRIHKTFNVKILLEDIFKIQTIRGIAEHLKGADQAQYLAVERAEEKEYYPLSSTQMRLYVFQQLDRESIVYNMPIFVTLEGTLEKQKLRETFEKLIQRHESLRTSFRLVDVEPVQKIHKQVDFKITNSSEGTNHGFVRAFDLSKAPLLRVGLFKTGEAQHTLMVDMHHIVSDALSHSILMKDFLLLYRGDRLEPLRLQYKDYSQWQSGEKEKERLREQENYWLKQLSPPLPASVLPFDHPRPGVRTYAGSAVDFEIGKKETRQLKELATQEGVTLQIIMAAIFHILLAKIGGREDIVTGTTSAGRRHADLEEIIGPFINTLVLRSFPAGKKTFREFLEEVREISLQAYENQDYPFDILVKKTGADRETGRHPIFDIMFEIQGAGAGAPTPSKQEIPGLKLVPSEMETNTVKFDQDWLGVETAEGIYFTAAYSTEVFNPETLQLMVEGFLKLIEDVVANPQTLISELDCRTSFEKELNEVENIAFNF